MHYNPQEPELTAESFGYHPLQSTGRERYYHSVEAFRDIDIRVTKVCSTMKNDETREDQQDEDREMAWKRLRPSAAASISLLTATIKGIVFVMTGSSPKTEGKDIPVAIVNTVLLAITTSGNA